VLFRNVSILNVKGQTWCPEIDMTPVVTISIPAYKQPEVLLRTVNSVLVQKNCEFEIVITDDSDDDSVEVALGYLKADDRIRYIKNPTRLGAIGNWNASIANARTDIVKILHHDDWFVDGNSLAQSVQPIISGDALVVFSACRAMSVDGHELFKHSATTDQIEILANKSSNLAYANFIGPPSVVTFSREVFVPFNSKYTWLSDVDFYIRLIEQAHGRFRYLYEPLINVTSDSPEQLSRECEALALRSLKENISLFAECGVDRQKKLAIHFFSLAQGLAVKDLREGIYFAVKLGELRIASALFKGLVFSMLNGK